MRHLFGGRSGLAMAFVLGAVVAATTTAGAASLITGKQIKNGSISAKDLSKAVRAQLRKVGPRGPEGLPGAKGDIGPQGPQGQPAAPPASEVFAYATVHAAGTLAADSYPRLNLEQAALTHPATGEYCVAIPGAKSAMVTPASYSDAAVTADVYQLVNSGTISGCSAAANFKVTIRAASNSAPTDNSFLIWALR
jgi:hypothetical protein